MYLHKNVQKTDVTDSSVDLTPKHQHDIQTINNGGSLEPTTQDGISQMYPQILGNCYRNEPNTSKDDFFCVFF